MVETQIWQWPINTLTPANTNMFMFMATQELPGRGKRDLRVALAQHDVELAKDMGRPIQLTEPEEVAEYALEGIRAGRFWILGGATSLGLRDRLETQAARAARHPVVAQRVHGDDAILARSKKRGVRAARSQRSRQGVREEQAGDVTGRRRGRCPMPLL